MKTIHHLDGNDMTSIIASHFGVSTECVLLKAGRVTVGTGENRHTEYAINCTVTIDTQQQDTAEAPAPEPESEEPPISEPAPLPVSEPEPPRGVKGRLRLYCPDCQNAFGTFLREPQTKSECRCGHVFDLTAPLAKFSFTCPSCDRDGWGKTNSEDAEICVDCRCGEELVLEWNARAKEYRN